MTRAQNIHLLMQPFPIDMTDISDEAYTYFINQFKNTVYSVVEISEKTEKRFHLSEGTGAQMFRKLALEHRIAPDLDSKPLSYTERRCKKASPSIFIEVPEGPEERKINYLQDIQINTIIETAEPTLSWTLLHDDKKRVKEANLPHLFRIVKINSGEIYTISIDGRNTTERPRPQSSDFICTSMAQGKIRVLNEDPGRPVEAATPKMLAKRDFLVKIYKNTHLTDTVIEDKNGEYKALIQYINHKYNINTKTASRYVTTFWRNGMTSDSFLPHYSKQGRPPKIMDTVTVKSDGMNQRCTNGSSKEAVGTDFSYFADIIDNEWASTKGRTLIQAYNDLKRKYYSSGFDENGDMIFLPDDQIPSIDQFAYFAVAYIHSLPEKYLRKRLSGSDYDLLYREVLHHSDSWCPGPGSLYAADASLLLDTELVDTETRKRNVGRCTTTILVDLYSRAIPGFCCQFADESYYSYVIALHCAATKNKEKYFKRLGVYTRNSNWPDAGIPAEIFSDNGPLTENLSNAFCEDLGINLDNTLSHRGDLKGVVESFFHTMHLLLKAYLNGVVNARQRANGGKNNSYDARLTYTEFLQILVDAIGVYNRTHTVHIPAEADLISDTELKLNPLSLWEHGKKYRPYSVRSVDPYKMIVKLLPKKRGTISKNGLCVNSFYYTNKTAAENGTFIRKKALPGKKNLRQTILVHYDPLRIDQVYQYDKKSDRIISWQLSESNGYVYYGKTLVEASKIKRKLRRKEKEQKGQSQRAECGLIERTNIIVENAASKTQKALGKHTKLDISHKTEAAEYEQILLNDKMTPVLYDAHVNEKNDTIVQT